MAWSILQCLLASAKSELVGFVIYDDVEVTLQNEPRDRVFEWFIGPSLIIREQIKKLQLNEDEKQCLIFLVMNHENKKLEDWDDCGFLSDDNIRRAQLRAIIRRLQGIVASMSRIPTFWRQFRNLVKFLSIEAIQAGGDSADQNGEPTEPNDSSVISYENGESTDIFGEKGGQETKDVECIV